MQRTLSVGLIVVLVGCSAPQQQSPHLSEPPRAPSVFAYTTYIASRVKYEPEPIAELGVVRGGMTIAQIPGRFLRSGFVTDDGERVVARQYGGPDDGHLVVYDLRTGRSRTLSFAIPVYSTAYPGGGSTVVWWDRPNRLMRADLADEEPKPEMLRELSLPPLEPGVSDSDVYIAAERDGQLLVTRHERAHAPNGGPQSLYLISRDGRVRGYGVEVGTAGIWNASFSPDGKRIAYNGVRYPPPREPGGVSSCFHDPVGVLDLETGQTETTDVQGHPDDDTESYVRTLWWGLSGTLHASSAAVHCGPGGQRIGEKRFAEWTKDGDIWDKVGEEPVLESVELADGAKAVVLQSGDPADDDVGTLYYVTADGRRTQIAERVVDVVR
ncbi:hypothetical protein FZI91_08560 [Mycobacterium sp. CBMA271]|uniref:hypothetical protein n=1 Tax=unclassified Mycobacteroides TaxID=2618759 RepID=UPI0012DC026A|nr:MULTISPECIES: hypothetical protein [unclassified Mycobacteroides]MUM19341.1 hypothetical protein [Mycobacteroides sp. CBMA 326]MUM21754.1 hypothetical protein [Mycobacteroides sp. CBMA 271]